jgi:hypothetical protein
MSIKKFKRPLGDRAYKKLYVIVTEGAKTEPQYFSMFNHDDMLFRIKCINSKDASAPPKLLGIMKKFLGEESLKDTDEAWIVIDKDSWTNEQLQSLLDWSKSKENFGFALSNPKFEYWLLLHFEDGNSVRSSQECTDRLVAHLPNFRKGFVDITKLKPGVENAIQRAKRKDNPPCEDWPKINGSTLYRLIEKLT